MVDARHLADVLDVPDDVLERGAGRGVSAPASRRRTLSTRRPSAGSIPCPPPRPRRLGPPCRGVGDHELGTKVTMHTPPLAAQRRQHVVGHVARAVADRPGGGVAEDRRHLGRPRARRASCRGTTWERSTSMPIRFISRTTSTPERSTDRPAPARRWPSRPTGRCCCGSASGSARRARAASAASPSEESIEWPPSAPSSEAIRPCLPGAASTSSAVRAKASSPAYLATSWWPASTCSSVALTASSPAQRAGTNTDQNCAAHAAGAQPGQVGVGRAPPAAMSRRSKS